MKAKMIILPLSICWMLVIGTGFSLPSFAKDDEIGFNKDVAYDIYYEVGAYEVNRLRNVKVLRKINEGNITFLVIDASAGLKGKEGYVLLDKVRAILPTGYADQETIACSNQKSSVVVSGQVKES